MSDRQAFERLKQGDRAAMEWVYRKKRDSFVAFFIKKYKTPEADARDLAMDALIAMTTYLERDPNRTLVGQLLTMWIGIGKNIYLGGLRSDAKLPIVNWEDFFHFTNHTEGSENPFEVEDFEAIFARIEPLVNKMGEPCRTIIKLRFWGNKKYREISGHIINDPTMKDMTPAAVKMKCRSCIEDLGGLLF